MSHPSQIFEALVSLEEYELIAKEKDELLRANQKMAKQLEDLNKKIMYLTEGGEQILDYPKKLSHLSKKVIQLSKLLLRFQDSYEQLKSSISNKENPQAIITQQKQRIAQLGDKLDMEISKHSQLNNQIQQLCKQIQQTNQQNFSLKQRVQADSLQYRSIAQQLARLSQQNQELKASLKRSQEEQQERQIIVLNERNIIEQQSNQLKRREAKLAELQAALHQKEVQIIQKYSIYQLQLQQRYSRKQEQLKNQLQRQSLKLQEQYVKQIASIKQYSIYDDKEEVEQNREVSQLREELAKFKEQNTNLHKRVLLAKKQKEDAINKVNYLKEYYQSVDNIDHSIINAYVMSLLAFKDKLVQVGQTNVEMKVAEKKNQMFQNLERKLKQSMK